MLRCKDFVPEVQWFPNLIFCLASHPHIVEDRYSVKKRMQDWITCYGVKVIGIETLPFEYGNGLTAEESKFRLWYDAR